MGVLVFLSYNIISYEVNGMRREDFPVLENKDVIYFDNAATTLKPKKVIQAMDDYYQYYTANIHR